MKLFKLILIPIVYCEYNYGWQWRKDSISCPKDSQPQLLFNKCWFCACTKCALDILFLIDQSQNAEPLCTDPMVTLRLSTDPIFDLFGTGLFDYSGARDQVDFVRDAIDQISQESLDNGSVHVSAVLYGGQQQMTKVFDFGEKDKMQMKCKLYGYAEIGACNLDKFNREPLCYQPNVYEVLTDVLPAENRMRLLWRTFSRDRPVTKVAIVLAADSIKPDDLDNKSLFKYLEKIHNPIRGFDRTYTIGTVKNNRNRQTELKYWKDLLELACKNEVCDRMTIYSPKNPTFTGSETTPNLRNGSTFITSLLDSNGYKLDPYQCYKNRYAENCRIKPVTRVRHSSDLAYIDETTGRIINENYNVEYQEPYNGIVPNKCCGHKPYHTDIRCCDEKTQQFVNYNNCYPDE